LSKLGKKWFQIPIARPKEQNFEICFSQVNFSQSVNTF